MAKILVIDDEKSICETLELYLTEEGYEVFTANTGTEGLNKAVQISPDLIILDVMMDRHTDGFDLCSDLKNDSACRMIPILMVTAVTEKTGFKFSPKTDGDYCLADDYISKPVPVSDLLSRVNRLIEDRKSC